jgi:prepilin-type N-terminal cleavage/methylation domain-containing protein
MRRRFGHPRISGDHRAGPAGPGRRGGFTLIEFIVALVVIAGAAAILTAFISPAAESADPLIQAQARSIATGYMDEILLRKHDQEPGDCAGGRGSWASIRCYDGLNQAPTDQFGNPIAGLGDYQVAVAVNGSAPATIVVDVTHGTGIANYTLRSQRGDY